MKYLILILFLLTLKCAGQTEAATAAMMPLTNCDFGVTNHYRWIHVTTLPGKESPTDIYREVTNSGATSWWIGVPINTNPFTGPYLAVTNEWVTFYMDTNRCVRLHMGNQTAFDQANSLQGSWDKRGSFWSLFGTTDMLHWQTVWQACEGAANGNSLNICTTNHRAFWLKAAFTEGTN